MLTRPGWGFKKKKLRKLQFGKNQNSQRKRGGIILEIDNEMGENLNEPDVVAGIQLIPGTVPFSHPETKLENFPVGNSWDGWDTWAFG